MSEPVAMNITADGEILATYWDRWGAYADSAFDVIKKFIEAYRKNNGTAFCETHNFKDCQNFVAKTLLKIGACVPESESEKSDIPHFSVSEIRELWKENAAPPISGLLYLSPEGINKANGNCCAVVDIDLVSETVCAGVFDVYDTVEEYWKEYLDVQTEAEAKAVDQTAEITEEISELFSGDISFENIPKCCEIIDKYPDGVRCPDGNVLLW